MKKASFIIISLIITVFITGNYFFYRQITKAHKREFKSFIRANFAKTETIEICPSELYSNNSKITWLDHNKEVLVNDEMYDIISITNSGIKVCLVVVKDSHEKELMDKYQNRFEEYYKTKSNKKSKTASDFFAMKYLCTVNQTINLSPENNFFSNPIPQSLESGYVDSATPPPDFL